MTLRVDGSVPSLQPEPDAQQPENLVCKDTQYEVNNVAASPSAQGSFTEQAYQASQLGSWSMLAVDSHAGMNRDGLGAAALSRLSATPPLPNTASEFVDYTSTLNGVSSREAFDYFKKNPTSWFGASGITLHPPTSELKNGARLFLEEPGMTPPVWAPIEVHVDEQAKTVQITTLDGHPLRGVNQFSFDDDAAGNCVLRQSSVFQLSSLLSAVGGAAMSKASEAGVPGAQDPIDRQHEIWRNAHANVADHARRM